MSKLNKHEQTHEHLINTSSNMSNTSNMSKLDKHEQTHEH
jgi:hypothetical protein